MPEQSLISAHGDINIVGGQFTMLNTYRVLGPDNGNKGGFEKLQAQAAVTALHNSLDMADSGRCHPHTRERVMEELFRFIQEDPKLRKNWILWLSGPAGSGKTTITRTLSYLCVDRNIEQASFFFCRLDLTRNGIKPLVATLAYQIACRFPSVKANIITEVEQRPHIFDLSVEEQFRSLITAPLNRGGWRQDTADAKPHPIVCVIDALDECEGKNSLQVQSNVVQTLYSLVAGKDSPVIFMLASRPEPNLRMSFNRINHSTSRVYLDNLYDPSVDIRRFVVDTFEEIKATHMLASSLPHDWPTSSAIDAIVGKSSGQFIYAATVMRYISSPLSDPATSLDVILHSVATESSTMPFTDLDDLFTFILGRARNWPVVSTILSCHLLSLKLSDISFSVLLSSSGHSINTIQRYLMGITSLAEIDEKRQLLLLHNESLVDFLIDRQRSGRFYVDLGRASCDCLISVLRKRTSYDVYAIVDRIIALLPEVINYSEELEDLLVEFSEDAIIIDSPPFLTKMRSEKLRDAFSNPCINGWKLRQMWRMEYELMEYEAMDQMAASDNEDEDSWQYYASYQPPEPGSHEWFQVELRDHTNLLSVKHLLASHFISKATGMGFSAVAELFGYDNAGCARVLSTLSAILEYDPDRQLITFYHGEKLLFWMLSESQTVASGMYHLDIDDFIVQAIQVLASSRSYQGNLFADLGSLLYMIRCPTTKLTSHLMDFIDHLSNSAVEVHVLDFTAFLDGLARAYYDRVVQPNEETLGETLAGFWYSKSADPTSYSQLLTRLVKFWAAKNKQLDAQFLSIPEFSAIWQKVV